MAVAYGTSAVTEVSGDGDVVVTKPASLASGDMMVAFCLRGGDGSAVSGFDTPTGWTAVDTVATTNVLHIATFAKVADSGDAAASDFTFVPSSTDGDKSVVTLIRVTSDLFTSSAANLSHVSGTDDSTGGENAISYAGLTPIATNPLLMQFIAHRSDTDIAFSGYAVANNDPSWTERYDALYDPAGIGVNYALASGDYAAATATGNFSAVVDTNGTYLAVLVSINESADVTVSPAVVSLTAAPQAPSVSGDANVSPAVVSITAAPQAPVLTQPEADWETIDKSAEGSTTNIPKS